MAGTGVVRGWRAGQALAWFVIDPVNCIEHRGIALAEIGGWPVGKPVDMYALFRNLAQRYAVEVLFGIADYHTANWLRIAVIVRLDLPGLPYRRVLRRAETLQSFVFALMAQARGCPMHSDVRRTMAGLVDEAGEPMSAARTAALMSSIALASYETTATTLAWDFVLLSQHPHVMTALANEVAEAGPIEILSSRRLGELKLLDAVLKETLRILTPVPMLGFKTLHDCEVAGFDLPEAATVMISPHLTHRLPELYDQPDRFLPERWFNIRPTTYEYLPFSGGPRRCPGYLFAMTNMRMALAVLLSRFNVGLVDGARYNRSYAAVNVPHGTVPALLSLRHGAPIVAKVPGRSGSVFEMFAPAAAA